MQSYTFASTEGMAALRAAFDASGNETYDVTMMVWRSDMAALVLALAAHARTRPDTDTAVTAQDLLIGIAETVSLSAEVASDTVTLLNALRANSRAYIGAWNRDQFIAATEALREYWENGPKVQTHMAGSLLGAIAETLGIEFI